MSCNDCENSQEEGRVAYYRWGTANIGIMACPIHAREVINALNTMKENYRDNQRISRRE